MRFRANASKSVVSKQLMGRIRDYIEYEGRLCSYDIELITPENVCGVLGGVGAEDLAMAIVRIRWKRVNNL